MRITDVRTAVVHGNFEWILVRVYTDEGLVGLGECYWGAGVYYIPLAAHNVSSPVGTLAACHACAGMRNFMVMEFHAMDVPWWGDLVVSDAQLIREGHIELPTGPGLGVELNEDIARAHLSKGSTFFA